ncbi:arginine--tRNA ligase [Nocardioides speluncae]|uniref:arginine--tRNA ligase n=1 Tax=Nocardioides speluncae TaxID=2670337 RepID=UPI000D68E3A4|nr:arginine--tRNA ligase [Nocardioides speluncae]
MSADLAQDLEQRIVAAVHAAYGIEITAKEAVIRPAQPGRPGDYQCNAAMPLAKRLGRPSPEVGAAIADRLDLTGLAGRPEVAGPGFLNIVFDAGYLGDHVAALAADEHLGVPRTEPRRVVVDYSSPNMAKEMHVGHLRSTIIGDALVRMLEAVGHEVVRQNHLGDWGTPFGMLVEHLVDEGWTGGGGHTVADLTAFYADARHKFDTDDAFADRSRKRVVALQAGDPTTLALWEELLDESKRHIEAVYELLDVRLTPDDYRGESSYNPRLDEVVADLQQRGLAVDSDGALCVFPPGFAGRDDEPLPLIIRKSGGGYGYDTTDLATLRYRTQELKADDIFYVVGAPQAMHFAMVFAAGREAGWVSDDSRIEHVPFGSVLGSDGRMLRTRAGATVKLTDLLTAAVDRAAAIVAERGQMDPQERAAVARAVGIGAVKYADLSSQREKDYTFDLDRMLAMEGNTAVYLQYAHARIRSMLHKADQTPDQTPASGTPVILDEPAERALALKLAQYPAAVTAAIEAVEPHRLCGYLYELAVLFSTFYQHCPVLTAPTAELRQSRLALSEHTARVLERALGLLGIEAPDRM